MNITDNLIRIKEGKDNIIKSLKNKGVSINDDTLINEIPTIIDNAEIGGGGDTPSVPTELVPKYDGASVFRIVVPNDNYEFAINLCNDATKAKYDVDWGDGSLETALTTDEQHHTYSKKGTYDVNIYNISKDITLGGYYNISIINGNYNQIFYLFNNTNNDIWSASYIENKDYICTNILIGKGITSIAQYTFQNCSSLISITIPDSITSIAQYTFQNCSSLTSINIPEGVTSIGSYVFNGCSKLQSINIPEGVTSIGSYVFNGCSSLTSINIPEGVTSIGSNAFENCSSLTSINIPKGVTSIGSYVFNGCSSLTSINIPEGATSIGNNAFKGCSSLTSINIPEGVTSIGNTVFSNCHSLQNIDIPNSVTSIGSSAFSGCKSLQNIDLSNVSSIGSQTFYDCTSLQSITCNALTAATIQSNSFQINKNLYSKRYLYVPKESTGYDSGNWKTYLIDKGWELRYIEDRVKTPTTLKLKTKNNFFHNLQAIGQANLIDYELIDNEYIYHFDDKITELIQYTFYGKVLEEIELPECVEILGKSAFSNSTYLYSLTCKAMTAPTIQSDTFSSVGTSVPSGTKILRIPQGSSGYEETTSEWYKQLIAKGYKVEYIVQPNNEIWYTTTDGNIVEPYDLPTDNALLSNTYENGKGVMVFENDITVLADAIFSQQTTLVSVKLPNTLTKINASTFNNCSNLVSVNIPNSVTEIGNYAFYNLYNLESIEIPEGVKKIGSNSFRSDEFESITLPSTINSIGNYAFSDMYELYNITSLNPIAPTIQQFTFFNIGRNATQQKVLRIPQGSSGYEEETSQWYKQLILNDWTIEYI